MSLTRVEGTSGEVVIPDRVLHYTQQAYAKNTVRAYQVDWRLYSAWCAQQGADPVGEPLTVAHYLAYLADEGKAAATIERKLAAICKGWEAAEKDNPRYDSTVRFARRGIRRAIGTAPQQVDAITPVQLRKMVSALPTGAAWNLRRARNRALLVVGFAGGMRRSELVGLNYEDVEEDEEGLRVRIRRSKTDQEGKGRVIGLPYGSVSEVCPVRSINRWVDMASITEGALFRPTTKNGRAVEPARLTTRQVANIVQMAAKKAGIRGRFAGHSLRSGLVTAAVRGGKSLDAIQRQTGHTSVQMLMRYVREQGIFTDNAASGLL